MDPPVSTQLSTFFLESIMPRCPCLIARLLGLVVTCSLSFASPATAEESSAHKKPDRLVIHEWGTFTCLQDETGQAIYGINTDDEAVPEFVHRIADLIPRPSELAPVYKKGVPQSHRQVRMRLETPVVYFHPPANMKLPVNASVQVDFQGGWLTEYFPKAAVNAPGLNQGNFRFAGLTPTTRGSLNWADLTIGSAAELPQTDTPVWLAPRAVQAATVATPDGDAEKYLFYRGVGNIPSPITVVRTSANDGLLIREDIPADLGLKAPLSVRAFWLVHVRGDGQVAYRSLGSTDLTGEPGRKLLVTALRFPDKAQSGERPAAGAAPAPTEVVLGKYAEGNLAGLREEMRAHLIADGLFEDEADAMLKTWELAYFKSPGLRLFYMLPQQWTNAVLPMKCSLAADISRTMVGRIELVTPRQRSLIKKISFSKVTDHEWFYRETAKLAGGRDELTRLWEGTARIQDFKLAVPDDYQAYLELGRFRDALLLDELPRQARSGIGRFVNAYGLSYFETDDEPNPAEATAAKTGE
jgi:hypothetical protein